MYIQNIYKNKHKHTYLYKCNYVVIAVKIHTKLPTYYFELGFVNASHWVSLLFNDVVDSTVRDAKRRSDPQLFVKLK